MAKRKKGSTALSGLGVKFGATVRKRYGKGPSHASQEAEVSVVWLD